MLPWSIEPYDEAYDGFWFDEDAWIPPQPLDSAWYEQNYIGDEDLEDDIVSDVSLAQLVYQSTGALLPRDMQRFDSGVKWLRRKGLKPSQVLRDSSRHSMYSFPLYRHKQQILDKFLVQVYNRTISKGAETYRLRGFSTFLFSCIPNLNRSDRYAV